MKRLKIAVDCDDVIVPTAGLILQHYNQTYGTRLQLKDFYSNDLSLWGAPDAATAIQRVEAYTKTDEYQQTKPFTEAIEIIRSLHAHHDLHIVTGRADFLQMATTDMLATYFPDIFKTVEFTNFFGTKSRPKADVCRELGVDFLIDDHLHHATTVAACGTKVLLFGDYPWNQARELPANIQRVANWQAVAELLI